METDQNSPFTNDIERSVASLSETQLILSIREWLGPVCPESPAGIGDDCAVSDISKDSKYLLTTVDGVAWGEHFDHTVPAEMAGRKLMARNLSDIASMGGIPRRAVVSLWLSASVSLKWLECFYRGIAKLAGSYHVEIVGGDVSRAPDGVFIADLCLQGMSAKPLQRRQVREGDSIWVTGVLGGSILGKHCSFEPRIEEGKWLNENNWAKSMMDISDGLAKDLPSLVGNHRVELNENLPISEAALTLAESDGREAMEHALCDGEDYELVFALDAGMDPGVLENAWKLRFRTPLTCIGKVGVMNPDGETSIYVKSARDAEFELLTLKGYEHF